MESSIFTNLIRSRVQCWFSQVYKLRRPSHLCIHNTIVWGAVLYHFYLNRISFPLLSLIYSTSFCYIYLVVYLYSLIYMHAHSINQPPYLTIFLHSFSYTWTSPTYIDLVVWYLAFFHYYNIFAILPCSPSTKPVCHYTLFISHSHKTQS